MSGFNDKSDIGTIAIIGIGCRFPGAKGPAAFWQLLQDGVDAITEVPAERFDIDAVYDPRPGTPGKLITRWGGFLEQIDQFDSDFFGISPREAARMDPQQRLLLEMAWEALEDAGQVPDTLAGSRTGVFIGSCYTDFKDIHFYSRDSKGIDIYLTAGSALSVLSGRVSYALGLQGPSMTFDTACSSSLVAVHLACQSLRSGECTLALAGGVNLILVPELFMGFSQAQMLAPDGRCKAFDVRANGFVRSDGIGVVVLKPLFQAQADRDPIYAVIRGSAVNNDGRSGGLLMTPSRQGQEAVLREAYHNAGVSPGQVHYVETHGTGTSVGDPIEVGALGAVLSEGRPKDRPCAIGSVKTNIGHTEGAAGVAGLIKVALSIKHRAIPASLHCQEPNPNIPWQDLPLVVQRERGSWPADCEPPLAGVSAFGISGTNAHVVVEEAPQAYGRWPMADGGTTYLQSAIRAQQSAPLLTLSANSQEALDAMARSYQTFLTSEGDNANSSLHDLCYTASVRRTHHDYRLAVVVHSRTQLVEDLEAFLQGEVHPGIAAGRRILGRQRKLVFVFPGQGAQWYGMGGQLLEQEPVFREALERCAHAMRPYVDWSLLEQLTADESRSRFGEVDIIQPALFAIQVALAALWRSWGIEPDAVVGQSMGEVAAAYVAGALSLEDAVRIICRRSRLVKSTSGQGGMAVVGLSLEQAQQALAGYEDRVSVAVSNSPTSTLLSGDVTALKEVLDQLERQDIFCRLVKVDFASHSPQMDPLRTDLLRALEELQPRLAAVPIYSTVTGKISDGLEFAAAYWWRNLREPVLFSTVVQQLVQSGHDIFLEISPHPIVLSAIQQGLQHLRAEGALLPSLRREEEERAVMLGSLGTLYTVGYPIDWNKQYPSGGRCIPLPCYPWQRERYWLDDQDANGRRIRKRAVNRDGMSHPLLDRYFKSAAHSGTYFWETEFSVDLFPYLTDHRVQGMIVLPAAAYMEMALAAATEAFGAGPHVLQKVTFKKALFLPEDDTRAVQLILSLEMPGTVSFQFFSRQADASQQQAPWMLHATGTIRLGQAEQAAIPPEHDLPETIQARCLETISSTEHYQDMQKRGLQYGPSFQGVEHLWRRDGEAIGRLQFAETMERDAGPYQIHPVLLDACFQVLAATLPKHGGNIEGDTYLPVGLDSLRLYHRPDPRAQVWSHALFQLDTEPSADILTGDMFLLDENGQVLLEALGLSIQRLERGARRGTEQDPSTWLYEIRWEPQARPQPDQPLAPLPPDQRSSWVIFTDGNGVGQTLQSLLEARGEICLMVSPGETYRIIEPRHWQLNPARPEEFQQLFKDILGSDCPPCRGVVHLWSLKTPPPEETTLASLEAAEILGCGSVLHLVQTLTTVGQPTLPRLWLVTAKAQAIGERIESVSIAQSPLWGLGKVISLEHPELHCTKVDLSSGVMPEEVQALFHEVCTGDEENEIVLRGDTRYVARLVRYAQDGKEEKKYAISSDEPFQMEPSTLGILDNFTLRVTTRRKPGPGEVEIRVLAVGVNFRDVMVALNLLPATFEGSLNIGWECSGRITALGEGVEGFQVGDEVFAVAPPCFKSYVTTSTIFVAPKPAHLSFEEATTIVIAFCTAYYAFLHTGRLSKGERVLIHAAAGGVGQAAVQIAQWIGAEIFATAGSEEKREFLRSQGIQHVLDSRSLDFADEVLRLTGGKGVDVVLNSLAGEFILKSLSTLAPGGRFLEIGKVDILQNKPLSLGYLSKNISFSAIDLGEMFVAGSQSVTPIFSAVSEHFKNGVFKPLPLQVFPISDAAGAFRYLAQAKHIGKVVVSLQENEVMVAPPLEQEMTFRPEGTYLMTGGLGGIGLSVAQWMVDRGARHLVLMGRNGASSIEAQEALEAMGRTGAQVRVARADVANEEQVASVLSDISDSMPPLRGVIHAAAVLDDGILLQLDQERLQSVMAPKISGAWNLHALTLNAPLDFFVLFSSAASLLGSPGQGNYSAANAFLDALALYRRTQGLPALSINWGPWSEIGLAAAQANRGARLAFRGFGSITPKQGLEVLGQLLSQDVVQVGVMPFNWRQWRQFYPTASESPLFAHVAREQASVSPKGGGPRDNGGLTRDTVLEAEPGGRQQLLESYLSEQIGKVLGLSTSRLSKLDVQQPLNRLGIDSLMAVELKNRVEIDLGVVISAAYLLEGPSIAQMAKHVLDQVTTTTSSLSAIPNGSEDQEHLLANLDQLSDEEVDSLLDDMLAAEEVEVRG